MFQVQHLILKGLKGLSLFVAIVIGLYASSAQATLGDSEPKVNAYLTSEYDSIEPGQTFYVLLNQEIKPHWHTYWRNPGDSGKQTVINWQQDQGFVFGDIEWPYPERLPFAILMNFGYSDQVSFPIKVTAPLNLEPGIVKLEAASQWLVCKDICIPESGKLSLQIRVGESKKNEDVAAQLANIKTTLPVDAGFEASARVVGETISLKVNLGKGVGERLNQVSYFPYQEGVMDNPSPQTFSLDGDSLILKMVVGWDYSTFANQNSAFDGILVLEEDAGEMVTSVIEIKPEHLPYSAALSTPQAPENEGAESELTLVTAIIFALLGGLILNLMPCVFPVLSIKILSLIQETHDLKGHGWVYTLGVVLSFVALALVLIVLRQGGAEIGWGFQLQSPWVVALLVYLFLLIGLNLSGYFEIGTKLMNLGQGGESSGYGGSFSTGVLAAVVAAPCSAPFMAGAIGYALTKSDLEALLIFASLGFGMALPYLVLCYWPAFLSKLPKPGAWMEKMKQLLAFPMYASAVWLFWVLSIQTGSTGVLTVAAGALMLVLAIWLLKQVAHEGLGRIVLQIIALALVITVGYASSILTTVSSSSVAINGAPTSGAAPGKQTHYQTYSETLLTELRKEGPVFVDFDAAWCITCKVNEAVAISRPDVLAAFKNYNIAYLKGDWTNQDAEISRKLEEYGRNGVPLYLFYRPGIDRAEVLPQILTEAMLLELFTQL